MSPPRPGGLRGAVDWLFRSRETGRIVIAQFPNVAFGIFLAATALGWLVHGSAEDTVRVVRVGALAWWAADEIWRGVNPWRRLLGGTVLVATVAGLLLGGG